MYLSIPNNSTYYPQKKRPILSQIGLDTIFEMLYSIDPNYPHHHGTSFLNNHWTYENILINPYNGL